MVSGGVVVAVQYCSSHRRKSILRSGDRVSDGCPTQSRKPEIPKTLTPSKVYHCVN